MRLEGRHRAEGDIRGDRNLDQDPILAKSPRQLMASGNGNGVANPARTELIESSPYVSQVAELTGVYGNAKPGRPSRSEKALELSHVRVLNLIAGEIHPGKAAGQPVCNRTLAHFDKFCGAVSVQQQYQPYRGIFQVGHRVIRHAEHLGQICAARQEPSRR